MESTCVYSSEIAVRTHNRLQIFNKNRTSVVRLLAKGVVIERTAPGFVHEIAEKMHNSIQGKFVRREKKYEFLRIMKDIRKSKR